MKKGCGKKIIIGYNKVLDCPIKVQCGITEYGNSILICEECLKSNKKQEGS